MKLNSTTVTIILSLIIIVAIGFFVATAPKKEEKFSGGEDLIPFAQCIAKSGAEFYGAFWCPHCQAQKALFGASVPYLPYIECSTPDMQGQTAVCIQKQVKSYPTWRFPDGTEHVGEMPLADLSAKTNCPLPSTVSTASTTASSTVSSTSSASSAANPPINVK